MDHYKQQVNTRLEQYRDVMEKKNYLRGAIKACSKQDMREWLKQKMESIESGQG